MGSFVKGFFVSFKLRTGQLHNPLVRNFTLTLLIAKRKMAHTKEVTKEDKLTKERRQSWLERYKAAMVLAGAGDALGYHRGIWEFQLDGNKIHKEVKEMGGIKNIHTKGPNWIVSDDTVMHLATAEALIEFGNKKDATYEDLYQTFARYYKACMGDMTARGPGATCQHAAFKLMDGPGGYKLAFNERGGGCGAAMRAMCIGMYYPSEDQLDKLIAVSIESGRMTHNHPTGYLGSLASAFFTHCAIQGYPLQSWGARLVELLDKAWKYVEEQGRDVEKNRATWGYFCDSWKKYLKLRGIEDRVSMPHFPDSYDVKERDAFYKSLSHSGWGGASGHDAPMIAYDALLGAGNDWEKLSERAFFHGGDSDSTAHIAGALFGILYGFQGVPKENYKDLEYRKRLEKDAEAIFNIAMQHLPTDASCKTDSDKSAE